MSIISTRDFGDPKITILILDELVRRGMDNMRFRQLHHATNYQNTIQRHRTYCAHLAKRHARFLQGGTNEQTARRLGHCLECLRAKDSWEIAIERAQARFRKSPN